MHHGKISNDREEIAKLGAISNEVMSVLRAYDTTYALTVLGKILATCYVNNDCSRHQFLEDMAACYDVYKEHSK